MRPVHTMQPGKSDRVVRGAVYPVLAEFGDEQQDKQRRHERSIGECPAIGRQQETDCSGRDQRPKRARQLTAEERGGEDIEILPAMNTLVATADDLDDQDTGDQDEDPICRLHDQRLPLIPPSSRTFFYSSNAF